MKKTHIKSATGRSFCQIENVSKKVWFAKSVAAASCRNCISLADRRPDLVVAPDEKTSGPEIQHEHRFVLDVDPGATQVEVVVKSRSLGAAKSPVASIGQPPKVTGKPVKTLQPVVSGTTQSTPPAMRFA